MTKASWMAGVILAAAAAGPALAETTFIVKCMAGGMTGCAYDGTHSGHVAEKSSFTVKLADGEEIAISAGGIRVCRLTGDDSGETRRYTVEGIYQIVCQRD